MKVFYKGNDTVVVGDDVKISDYAGYSETPPKVTLTAKEAAEKARAKRDLILQSEVDPIVSNPFRWADLTENQKQSWVNYRLALLNVPQQEGFPQNIVWPERSE
jgi:hypothetical protein